MPDRAGRRARRPALALVLAGISLLASVTAAPAAPARHRPSRHRAPAPKLMAWPAPAAAFPQRSIVLQPPARTTISAAAISLRENGVPVTHFSLAPLGAGHPGDFGTVLAIDQGPSMSGAGLRAAMAAARAVAAARTGAQQLGLVTFDATATRYLPLTADRATIARILASTPWTGPGANPAAAGTLALSELATAHLASGAVIVVSDGVGAPGQSSPAAQALRTAAEMAHVPIVTVGLVDRAATRASLTALTALAAQAPAQYFPATPAQLPAVVAGIAQRAAAGDVVRYRSAAPGGQSNAIELAVAGVPGHLSFTVADPRLAPPPAPPAAPTPRHVAPGAPVAHRSAPANPRAGLSFSQRFAAPGTLSSAPVYPKVTPAPIANPAPSPVLTVRPGFWGSSTAVLVVAIACGLLFSVIVLLVVRRPSKRAVRLRVGSFIPTETESGEVLVVAAPPDRPRGPLAMIARSDWWPAYVESVEVSRTPLAPVALVKRAASLAMVLAVAATLLLGSVIPGLLCLIAWPFALRLFVNRAADKQRAKFVDTLPIYLQDLASAIRVGRSLVAGLSVISENAEEPMRSELDRAVTDEALGRPLEQSLEAVARRMRSDDMDQVALIAALNRRSGSNVAEALDRVAEGARERGDLRREIKALTAQAKMSSLVLTALPGVLAAGLSIISPHYAYPLFHTTLGIVACAFGAALVLAGWKVMQKITRVEV